MEQIRRDDFLYPSYSDDSPTPPPPPAHLTLSMQQRTTPPYDSQQLYNPPPRNPFNDSSAALSHASRNSALSIPQEAENLGLGAAAGGLTAAAAEGATRPREGSSPPRTLDRNSSYSGVSSVDSPVSDPLARNPALQRGPYSTNSPYLDTAYAGPSAFRNSQNMPPPSGPSYSDGPYKRFSSPWDSRLDQTDFNPDEIADDGDDGLNREIPGGKRSMLSFGRTRSNVAAAGAAGAAGAAAGGIVDAVRSVSGSGPGIDYGPVPASDHNGGGFDRNQDLAQEAMKRKRKRLVFVILGVVAVMAVIAGAVAGGVIASRKNASNAATGSGPGSGSGSGGSNSGDSSDLTLNSPQIQQLMNNKNLHRVFPGFDYTPMNAQYPGCLTLAPSQDNVTQDVAILSQLTKTIRLYGTDCNQTDMVLEAFSRLQITDMKVWLGVWLDNNQTTNDRGMNAMWDILDRQGQDPFEGVIIGNEVLYRKDMTEQQLSSVVQGVRSNFTSKKYNLPIAVADLGDNWTSDLVQDVDVVMSNVHPFFGGVEASAAAQWTWDFWEQHDVVLTQGTNKQNIISETGWPSAGGNDCGDSTCTSSTQGAVASVDGMNTFMDGFVCQSLANSTNYFWFEAFDEPWKVIFNTKTDQWETQWGLMDENRNLKSGLQIPDCGGKTV